MNPWRWVDPRVKLVRLDGIRTYLEQHGYTEKQDANPNLVRFETNTDRNREQPPFYVLPASQELTDFVQSITYFLTSCSEVENRHPVDILEDVLQAQVREIVKS